MTSNFKQIHTFSSHRGVRAGVIIVVSLVLVLSGTLFAYGQTTKGQIHSGVTVAGADIGGMTVEQAMQILSKRFALYERDGARIIVDGKTTSVTLDAIGVYFDIDATVDQAFGVGRSSVFAKIATLPVIRKTISVDPIIMLDEQKFARFVSATIAKSTVPAKNATLEISNGTVSIVPEQNGKTLNANPVVQQLIDSARNLQTVNIVFASEVLHPEVTESMLEDEKNDAKQVVADPVIVINGKQQIEISTSDVERLIVVDTAGTEGMNAVTFSINQSVLKELLADIEAAVNIPAKPTFGFASKVEGEYAYKNSYGRGVDWDVTAERVLSALTDSGTKQVEIGVMQVKPQIEMQQVEAPKKEGKVISVDLTRQALFAFENGELMFWTRVSTGKGAFKTPTGEWKVYAKTPKQVMDGPGYYLPNVKWVMPYNGDYTLHTAYWHTNFGVPMSHGCTNMAENDAKWLFDWVTVGTPVVIYES